MCLDLTNAALLSLPRLAARIMWRVEREGTGLTEGCLVSVDDLQNHVEHFGEEEQKELRVDVDTFLQYWPPQSQQFSMQYISHIFGVVWPFIPSNIPAPSSMSVSSLLPLPLWDWKEVPTSLDDVFCFHDNGMASSPSSQRQKDVLLLPRYSRNAYCTFWF